MFALHLVEIEAVQWLAYAEQHEVGDVDDVVDGALAGADEQGLEPFGRFGHLDAADGDSRIAGATLTVVDRDCGGAVGAVGREGRHVGGGDFGQFAAVVTERYVAPLLCLEVASHAIMARRVHAVGRELDFETPVAFDVEIFGGRSAGPYFFGNHDDALVARSETEFVFGAYHAHRLDSAYLRFLDLYFLVAVIEDCADGGDHDGLPGGHVRGTADNLLGFVASEVDGGDVKMVGVGMGLAGEHLADHHAAKAAADALNLFDSVAFQTYRCQHGGQILGA